MCKSKKVSQVGASARYLLASFIMLGLSSMSVHACDEEKKAEGAETAQAAELDLSKTPLEIVDSIPQGGIISPFDPADPKTAEEGHEVFMETSCNGCHGGTGGGGMGPPLSNQKWVYGNDADTLFRLITLGTDELQKRGYTRKARENVRAPMPPHASGPIIIESLTSERILKIIAWIQSLHIDKE